MEVVMNNQPIINLGCLGSVSDGKTTLVKETTGINTQRHSDGEHRNITVNQGYGNMKIWEGDDKLYTTDSNTTTYLTELDTECTLVNHISFVDCPGHQELVQVMLASISLMDGAIIVIAVNEPLNRKPQLIQHLAAAKLAKLDKIIICMNKIDLVTKDILLERKEELDEMLAKYDIKPFAIIPTCFNKKFGINYLIQAIMKLFNPTRYIERASTVPLFRISRTFDINKPGANWDEVCGGVIGGSLMTGHLSIGDEIEIRPGQVSKGRDGKFVCVPIKTKILSIKTDETTLDEIVPGGLIGIRTDLDPFYCKANALVGNVAGFVGYLPEIYTNLTIRVRMVTTFGTFWEPKLNEQIMLQIGTKSCPSTLVRINRSVDMDFTFELARPACVGSDQHIIICQTIDKIIKIVAEGYMIE
jgi:translation initiation factor 2 subunit 3